MPEVQEVFRVSTQKVRPDPGFVDRQHDHRRKQERKRKNGALAVVSAIVVVVAMLVVRSLPGERPSQPAAPVRTLSRTVANVPFSFNLRTRGWEEFGGISINKSTVGPQGAEAMFFWTSFPDGDRADPCTDLLRSPIGPSAADLAVAVSTAPGTELVAGPSDVTVGGRAAKHVELTVRENVGCGPGFFYTWHDYHGGAFFRGAITGDTIKVWIVEVDGTRLFLEAVTTEEADSDLQQEIQRIVGRSASASVHARLHALACRSASSVLR